MTNKRITLKDVYDVVNRLEDKVDRRLVILECRVDKLENFKTRVITAAGIIGAVAGGLISWVWDKITGQ